jgi:hypothetical protein
MYPTAGGVVAQPYSTNQSGATWGSSGAINVAPDSVLHAFLNVANDAGTQQAFTNWVIYSDQASEDHPDFVFLDRADDNSVAGSESILQYRSTGAISGSRVFSLFDTLNFQSGRQQFLGLIIVEIKNAASRIPDGHGASVQSVTGTTTDSIICGATKSSGINTPGLVLSAVNNSTAVSSPVIATPGTGFTDGGRFILFDGTNPYTRLEYRRVTGVTGVQNATFTPPGTDIYVVTTAIYSEINTPAAVKTTRRNRRQGGLAMGMALNEWF